MKQTLVIVRGAPASGKTTLCGQLRDTEKRVAWVSVDGVKPIFSHFDDRDVDISYRTALVLIKYLLEEEYSLVFDGIFVRPGQLEYLNQAINIAKEKGIEVKIYQLTCSLETTLKRQEKRNWTSSKNKEEGMETVRRLYQRVLDNPIEGAIELNTEKHTLEECIKIVKKNFE